MIGFVRRVRVLVEMYCSSPLSFPGENGIPNIPSRINNVQINFAGGVNEQVEQHMVGGLKHCIKQGIA